MQFAGNTSSALPRQRSFSLLVYCAKAVGVVLLCKHMASIGHPILGDRRYSHTSEQVLFLWAIHVDFPHPHNSVATIRATAAAAAAAAETGNSADLPIELERVVVDIPEPEIFEFMRAREQA
jgi:hypothetical protein